MECASLERELWLGGAHAADLPGLQVSWHTGRFSPAALAFPPFLHTRALCAPIQACTCPSASMQPCTHLSLPAHACVHDCAPIHLCSRLSVMHTSVHLCVRAFVLVFICLCICAPAIHLVIQEVWSLLRARPCAEHREDEDEIRCSPGGQINK